ncbi:MAG: hypothetical protein SGPRY_013939, partial [Prymnesium sp.]
HQSCNKTRRGLSSELEASRALCSELEASLARAEWRAGQLNASREGQQRLIELFEEERAARGVGGEGEERESEVRLELAKSELSAALARIGELEKQAAEGAEALAAAHRAARAAEEAAARVEEQRVEEAQRRAGEEEGKNGGGEEKGGGNKRVAAGPMEGGHLAEGRTDRGYKVLHLSSNPTSESQQMVIEGLRAEVRGLQLQLEASGGGGGEGEGTAEAAAHLELQAQQLELARKLKSAEVQKDRLQRYPSLPMHVSYRVLHHVPHICTRTHSPTHCPSYRPTCTLPCTPIYATLYLPPLSCDPPCSPPCTYRPLIFTP